MISKRDKERIKNQPENTPLIRAWTLVAIMDHVAGDIIVIKDNRLQVMTAGSYELFISNISGRAVISKTVIEPDTFTFDRRFGPGVYFITVKIGHTKRLLKYIKL